MAIKLHNSSMTINLPAGFFLLCILIGCVPLTHPPGEKVTQARLNEKVYITEDGVFLPVKHWLPKSDPVAIVIALHGFNDYSEFFQGAGQYLSDRGIACFAYDQRGFGASTHWGLWAGSSTYSADLITFVYLLKQRYPNHPIYLLGESMGGAVILNTLSQLNTTFVTGSILVAPAVWARSTMPWYQTSLLWALAHSFPSMTLTGRGLKIMASDNIDMLRALGKDPRVIKATRVEAMYGLTDLMDQAFSSAEQQHGNTLLLYGEKDEIIPKKATYTFLQKLLASEPSESSQTTVAFYQKGYHMLLRDKQAATVWQDIAAWISKKPNQLPSGGDKRAQEILTKLTLETSEEVD